MVAEPGGSESCEAASGAGGVHGSAGAGGGSGWIARTGRSAGGGGGGVTRARSLDFLSIVTRLQLARRARAAQLRSSDDAPPDEDDCATYDALQLDFIPDDSFRCFCLPVSVW